MSNVRHVISVSGGKDSDATLKVALNCCPPGTVIPIFYLRSLRSKSAVSGSDRDA